MPCIDFLMQVERGQSDGLRVYPFRLGKTPKSIRLWRHFDNESFVDRERSTPSKAVRVNR